jgi:putative spermidine/putrescine transport system permease protein
MKTNPRNTALVVTTYFLCALTLFPIALIFATSLTTTKYLVFPPVGFTLDWYRVALTNASMLRALLVSTEVGLISAFLATSMGIIGGLYLSKSTGWAARAISALFLAPLTVPMIVLAIGLLFFLTSVGLVRSVPGLVAGHVVITFPYAIRMISASVGRGIQQIERAAAILGANPWQGFRRVTFPSLRAGVVAGALFAFLISFNNVTIALFVSGVRSKTIPVLMLNMTQEGVSPEIAALASVLILITYLVMIILEKRFGIYRVLERQSSR